jgi:hypothetical protein
MNAETVENKACCSDVDKRLRSLHAVLVVGLQEKMRKALDTFDTGLARNPRVRINEKAGGWISVTPLTAQPEPTNLPTATRP